MASRLCGIYEASFGYNSHDKQSQINNWHKHVDGELAIIAASGPASYSHGYWHQFFTDGRLHITISALERRRRCVLDTAEWKTLPWSEIPKTPKDLLLDIMVEMPGFLEHLNTLNACTDATLQDKLQEDLRAKCWQYDEKLARWRDTVGITDPSYQIYSGNTLPSVELVSVSQLMSLYWCICVVVYSTLHFTSGSAAAELLPHMDPRLYCRRIAGAIPILLHPLAGHYGAQVSNLPTVIALTYLQAVEGNHMSKEKRMIIEAFRKSAYASMIEDFFTSTREHWKAENHPAFIDIIPPEATKCMDNYPLSIRERIATQ
ncbi:hypothetical protein OQA88_7872 [Cercophora sp. LCS_1]